MADETILVVDDSLDFLRLLEECVLAPLGFHIICVTDGRRGLEAALAHHPDLIMLDMMMPLMNGMQMLAALRRTDCQTPVIFMTAHGSENIAVEALRLGVRDYLAKPFTRAEAQQAIGRALQESRLAREKEALARDLVVAETVRQTVVTLSHHVNNHLMALDGGLTLLAETLQEELPDHPGLLTIVRDNRTSATQIAAVLRVLQRVTQVRQTTYHGQTHMVDIETALREELASDRF